MPSFTLRFTSNFPRLGPPWQGSAQLSKNGPLTKVTLSSSWSQSHPKIWLGVKVVQEKVVKYSQVWLENSLSTILPVGALSCLFVSHAFNWKGGKREGLTSSPQFHINRQVTDALAAQGLPVAEYDGGVNVWANSVEDLMAVSPNGSSPLPDLSVPFLGKRKFSWRQLMLTQSRARVPDLPG